MPDRHDEDELAALLQGGYRYALSLVREKARAEDLLQEAWLATLRADGARTKPYLFTAIRSRYINANKRDQLVPLVSIDDIAELIDPDTDQEYGMFMDELDFTKLDAALAELRAVEREALYLMVVEGYTAQEVADLTGQPRNTVLSLSHRARRKVRNFMEKHYAEVKL